MTHEHGGDAAVLKRRTRVAAARDRLRDRVTPHGRTEGVPVADAAGRTLATDVTAARAVPPTDRAAVDGWAVTASDTVGASPRAPAILAIRERAADEADAGDGTDTADGATDGTDTADGATDGTDAPYETTDTADTHTTVPEIEPGEATPVHTGEPLPAGADAVVRAEYATRVGDEVEIGAAVPERGDVLARGEDVTAGQSLYRAGHRLRATDLGLLRGVGRERVTVAERPRVAVVPTGDEVVSTGDEVVSTGDEVATTPPGPGETLETNGVVVAGLTAGWGGDATVTPVAPDDPETLRRRLSGLTDDGKQSDANVSEQPDADVSEQPDADVVVTVGGTAVGGRDHLPSVLADLGGDGEPFVRGVAAEPGHPTTLAVVGDTPVVCLPGYPVACVVAAVQFLRPVVRRLAGGHTPPHPTTEATLTRKVASGPGVRTFARVRLHGSDRSHDAAHADSDEHDGDGDEHTTDTPGGTRATHATPTDGGASARSAVGLADGWVVVPESREGYDAGETVTVELWELPAAGPAGTVGWSA